MKYHVNSQGNAGPCRARKVCPFGDLNNDHFATPQEAQKHYERLNEPKSKITGINAEHLSAFRRNGDFREQEGDAALMEKLEAIEDGDKLQRLSILELERVSAIAQEKLSIMGHEEEGLDRYYRGVCTRIATLKKRIDESAIKARAKLKTPESPAKPVAVTRHRAWELEKGDFIVANGIRYEIVSCKVDAPGASGRKVHVTVTDGVNVLNRSIGINDFINVGNPEPKESQLWD